MLEMEHCVGANEAGTKRTWDDLLKKNFRGKKLFLVGKMNTAKHSKNDYVNALDRSLARNDATHLTLRQKGGGIRSKLGLELPEAQCTLEVLATNTTLEYLNLSGNDRLGDRGAFLVARMLETNKGLKELVLETSGLTHVGCAALAQSLEHNTTLQSIDLSFNHIVDPSPLIRMNNRAMKKLNLQGGYPGLVDEAAQIGPALSANTSLEDLNLWNNPLESVAFAAIGNALHTNSTLGTLQVSVRDWQLYLDGGRSLLTYSNALQHNQTLQKLSISTTNSGVVDVYARMDGVEVEADDWSQFFCSLNKNYALEELSLWCDIIFNIDESEAFAKGLAANTSLKKLSIGVRRCVGGSPEDILAPFARVLKESRSLTSFEVYHNPSEHVVDAKELVLEGSELIPFFEALDANTTLASLVLPASRQDQERLLCYCRLNLAGPGRAYLKQNIESAPMDDWINAMVDVKDHVACVFHLLHMNPGAFAASALAAFEGDTQSYG